MKFRKNLVFLHIDVFPISWKNYLSPIECFFWKSIDSLNKSISRLYLCSIYPLILCSLIISLWYCNYIRSLEITWILLDQNCCSSSSFMSFHVNFRIILSTSSKYTCYNSYKNCVISVSQFGKNWYFYYVTTFNL